VNKVKKSVASCTAVLLALIAVGLVSTGKTAAVASPAVEQIQQEGSNFAENSSLPPLVTFDFTSRTTAQLPQPNSRNIDPEQIIKGFENRYELGIRARQSLIQQLEKIGTAADRPTRFSEVRAKKISSQLPNRKSRIIGGSNAEMRDAPWQVALVSSNSSNVYQDQFCGGSIIAATWVLTAAHCVEYLPSSSLDIVVGLANLPQTPAKSSTFKVKNIITHPLYGGGASADIALLELSKPLKFRLDYVEPIDLAQPSQAFLSGDVARISGWGVSGSQIVDNYEYFNYPSQLQLAETVLIDCPDDYIDPVAIGSIVCAGSYDGSEADSCYGDSGGPLTVGRLLLGVTSFGSGCPPAGIGAYTSVPKYAPWILCHATVANPFGGPYVCGDELGFVDVSDTVKVSPGGAFPRGSRVSVQWLANGAAIKGATKNSLALSSQWGKTISVRITVGGGGEVMQIAWGNPVEEAMYVQVIEGSKFMPCTRVNFSPPNQGKCQARGFDGSLQSSPGYDPKTGWTYGFWAMRDFNLPKNTQMWTWGLFYPHVRGSLDLGLGADYFGAIGTSKPLTDLSWFVDTNSSIVAVQFPRSSVRLGFGASEYGESAFEGFNWWGMGSMSTLQVGRKGRVILGTFGEEGLGSHLDFWAGYIIAIHR